MKNFGLDNEYSFEWGVVRVYTKLLFDLEQKYGMQIREFKF